MINRVIRKVTVLVTFMFVLLQTNVFATAPSLPSEVRDKLSPLEQITKDIASVLLWGIWIGGPVLLLWQFILYGKANDPGDRREHKRNMGIIIATAIGAQLVIWFLRDYLLPKFIS